MRWYMSCIDICPKWTYTQIMQRTVILTNRVTRELGKLPVDVQERFAVLVEELRLLGPVRGTWKNYRKLQPKEENKHHCHLQSGRPTYVACWRVVGPNTVEVYYVGTHENAPY